MPVDVPVKAPPLVLAIPPSPPKPTRKTVRKEKKKKVRGIRPSMVLAAVGEGPTSFAEVGHKLRISAPAARDVVLPLVAIGKLYKYSGGGRTLITAATLPRCPTGGALTLRLWPYLCRGVYSRAELTALTDSRGHSVSVALTNLVRSGHVNKLEDGRYTRHRLTQHATGSVTAKKKEEA